MNTKQTVTRSAAIFASLSMAGIAIAVGSQVVPDDFAQTLMIAIGTAIFGSALTFFLIRMSYLNK